MKRTLVLVFVSAVSVAHAQTAASTGIIVAPDGRCLDLLGHFNAGKPPPNGTPVTLARCNGLPSQRWTATYGDFNDIRGLGGLHLIATPIPSGTPGAVSLSVHDRGYSAHELRMGMGNNAILHGALCLTQPRPAIDRFELAPCNRSPTQLFRLQ